MNVERMVRLVELMKKTYPDGGHGHLEGERPVRFRLSVWTNGDIDCATAACACGTAALDPWFQEQGLRLFQDATHSYKWVIKYAGETYMQAAASFFGITRQQASELFDPVYYPFDPSPKIVMERICKFIQDNTEKGPSDED